MRSLAGVLTTGTFFRRLPLIEHHVHTKLALRTMESAAFPHEPQLYDGSGTSPVIQLNIVTPIQTLTIETSFLKVTVFHLS